MSDPPPPRSFAWMQQWARAKPVVVLPPRPPLPPLPLLLGNPGPYLSPYSPPEYEVSSGGRHEQETVEEVDDDADEAFATSGGTATGFAASGISATGAAAASVVTTGSIPPELPPTVEEAYKRKCIELKQRLNEVEAANDAQRLRIERARRSVQKMRLERAFLLEQLAKRTSTNVEDSEGSPSPPPTPKEKPLRTKRGHRKPDLFASEMGEGRPGSHFIQQGPATLSPASEAFSHSHTHTTHTHPDPLRNSTPQAQSIAPKRSFPTNGTYPAGSSSSSVPPQTRRPKNAFELYCNETRPILESEHQKEIADGTYDIEGDLAKDWRSLEGEKKEGFTQRFEQMKRAADLDKEAGIPVAAAVPAAVDGETRPAEDVDEDTEMADDAGTPGAGAEVGGFTAVNRT